MTEVQTDAMECARRSLQAAFEHVELGQFKTAGALFRAVGRYVDRIGEESLATTGVVVQLSSPARFGVVGSAAARDW